MVTIVRGRGGNIHFLKKKNFKELVADRHDKQDNHEFSVANLFCVQRQHKATYNNWFRTLCSHL